MKSSPDKLKRKSDVLLTTSGKAQRYNKSGQKQIKKPIYFAVDETVDNDPTSHEYIGYPKTYFAAIHSIMQTLHYNPHHYSIGLYGPGLLAEALRAAPFNYDIHLMLPGATSYAGYNTEAWNIKQKWIDPGYDLDKTSETRDSGVW